MIAVLLGQIKSLGDEFLTFKHVDTLAPNFWADNYYIMGYERLKLYNIAQSYDEFRLSLDDIEEIERYKSMMYFAIDQWKPTELENQEE